MPELSTKPNGSPQPTSPQPKLIVDRVPLAWKPYLQLSRIDLFSGSLLLFWPLAWGLTLAAIQTHVPLSTYISQTTMFLFWGWLLNCLGCIWNDICDRDYDRLVERTKNRPLAAGTISVTAAVLWMCPHILLLIVILSRLNNLAMVLGALQAFFFNPLYPYMKRITNWPQAWLGLTFAWGGLIGWSTHAPLNWPIVGLFLFTGISWTIFYDTVYAMQDRKDDTKAGISSTAVLFGDHARLILGFFASLFVLGLLFIGVVTHQHLRYFILSVLGSALHFTWQITTVNFEDAQSCVYRFKSNGTQLGYIAWSGMLANYVLSA